MSNSSVKIAILCLPGLQSFLKDIVEHLNRKYDVLTCFDGDPQKISSVVNWADIVWIEWANELAVGLTNNPALLNEKYVICRLHRYEAFVDDFCLKIDWSRIDTLVFVGAFMESMLKARVKDLDQRVGRITTFPNGIDLDKMSFKDRKNGYDLAYVGYINYNKGPMLLLQAFKTLVQADDRYKLHIAGKIQNMHLDYYFTHMVDELNLTENIQFDGWIKDVNLWLQDKQYLVSSSVHESQGVGIMEAMACGIKPVIHNFVGASSIYPEKFIWNTIPEFVDHITKEAYDSAEYRKFVARRYSLVEQMQQIDELIAGIVKKNMSPVIVTDQERSGSALLESETVTENQDSGNPQGLHPQIKGTLEKCIRPGMRVLDMGCKNGQISRYMAELGASVVGVDRSAESIGKAQSESGHPNVTYQAVNYDNMDLEQKFDMITLIQELEHIPSHKMESFLKMILGHASERTVIYVDIRDGRYIQYRKMHQPTTLISECDAYPPDSILSMFSRLGFYPYHIHIYGDEAPVQFNEYLFATRAVFNTTYENAA